MKEPVCSTKEDKFVSKQIWADNELKEKTVGLIQLEEFQKIKENIDKGKLEGKCESRKNVKKARKHVLSFDPDEEQEDIVFSDSKEKAPIIKVKKNPCIDTSFLPDREREEKDKLEREQLKMQWIKEQEAIKAEKIKITYSYWDGIGSRDCIECKKGDTIGMFLDICRQRWPELREVSVDRLMYIKEDLIIPHHYRFYDFIVNKTRGKSGSLFSFDVHEDVRFLNDATVETQESHSGKVIKRSWYEKNKHIFPASRWEVFDPRKDFGKYSIKDRISKS